jgi:hypothetical protein
MDISKKEQKQTAGNNAVQCQIESQNNYTSTQVNYFGVTPTEVVTMATTVYNQMYALSAKNYAEIASTTVEERINAFGCELFPRLEKIEGALEKFKDPRFEFLLRDAQVSAAKTDRHDDLCLLSELLSCHVLKGSDKKIDAGISHAIKIIDEIDNDALCALTVACAFGFYKPISGSITEGLAVLNGLYEKLLYLELPQGMDWLDHLDMLGAIRMSSLKLKRSKEYLCERFDGYVCVGIAKDSEELSKAYKILDDNHFSHNLIEDNSCLDGYVRLKYVTISDVKSEYKEVVQQVLNLYSKDKTMLERARNNFIGLWDSIESLRRVRNWWDQIPSAFEVSYIGRVLAQTNAKRVFPQSPDLI